MNGHHLNSHLQPSLQPLEMSSDIEFGIPSPLVQLFEKAQQLFPMNQTAIGSIPILPVQDMELMSSHSAGTPELDSRGNSPESSNGFYHESPVLEFKNLTAPMQYNYGMQPIQQLPSPPPYYYPHSFHETSLNGHHHQQSHHHFFQPNEVLPPLQAHQFHSIPMQPPPQQPQQTLYGQNSAFPSSFSAPGGTYHFVPNTSTGMDEAIVKGKKTGNKTVLIKKVQKKRFICPQVQCGRAFARNFNMQSHLKAHLGIKDFDCLSSTCQKSFSRRHDRQRHMLAVHPDEVEQAQEEAEE